MSSIEQLIGLAALDADMKFTDPKAAELLDQEDTLKQFRTEFRIPTNKGIGAALVANDFRRSLCSIWLVRWPELTASVPQRTSLVRTLWVIPLGPLRSDRKRLLAKK